MLFSEYMKNVSIGQRIVLGFATIILVVAAFGVFTHLQLRAISRHSTIVTRDCLPGINLVGQMEFLANEMATFLLKDLMTKNEDLRAEFAAQIQTNLQKMAALTSSYGQTVAAAKGRGLFDTFSNAERTYAKSINEVLALSLAGKNQEA